MKTAGASGGACRKVTLGRIHYLTVRENLGPMPMWTWQIAAASIAAALIALSSGAGFAAPIAPHPGDHFEVVTIDHLSRSYIVHVPPGLDGHRKVPVVIMLHGAGGSGEEAESYTGFDDESDSEGFVVAYPNATLPFPNRPSGRYTNPSLWHERTGLGTMAQHHRDDINFISEMIDELEEHYFADPDRIYVTGFSNGASMTFSLGINLSERLAAIAPVSGQLLNARGTLHYPLPLLFIIGDEDPIHFIEGDNLPFTGADEDTPVMKTLICWKQMLGCSSRKVEQASPGVERMVFRDCSRGGEIVVYTVEGLGHVWPGGPNMLMPFLGNSSHKLLATDVIWEFFKAHPRVRPAARIRLAKVSTRAAASPRHP
jgi:polyhydroxybutyrate depolymerase